MNNNSNFQLHYLSSNFEKTLNKFKNLLVKINALEIQDKLTQELEQHNKQGFLTLAFIGQYSSGKSTIISGLTGRRDIKIDADIATDKTTNYDWNGIKIIDTPGLFTDRKDHDAITYDTIDKADLLVFCLTYMLFDDITIENFKKLAYEKAYRWKIMLVINKMSDEAGDEQEKINNYRHSLNEALKPQTINEFPLSFIDAKDYCEGIDNKDDFLLEISNFPSFIDALNNFVQEKGESARFDTPIRIALSHLEEVELLVSRDSQEDSAFFEMLNQLSRRIRQERNYLRNKVKNISLTMSASICEEGEILAAKVGEKEFENRNKQSEIKVRQHYEQAEKELQELFETACNDLRGEIKEVLENDLFSNYIAYLNKKLELDYKNPEQGTNIKQIKAQIQTFKEIGSQVGIKLTDMATNSVSTSSSTFLTATNVSGSSLHNIVLGVGNTIGFKFQPWQAVNIAKNIGNAAQFLGPALAIGAFIFDCIEADKEREREQQMADIRKDITSQFQKTAKDLEHQIDKQLSDFEKQLYNLVEEKISLARQQQQQEISSTNIWAKETLEIRREFQSILSNLS